MADAGRRALVDLSGIDLTAPGLAEGSVLEHALARVRRERDQDGWGYASFINTTTDLPRDRPAETGASGAAAGGPGTSGAGAGEGA